ncbi:RNA-binding S4 domain-containing protein [Rathayibacter rathayi]|uniref:RNA-binding S4 domain-containing protein n=1 Tax=Rathayibacter rathayi TaxID=33887 RepID=UPI001C66B767|nr:RNA-binding S4 domain-containing protein [Rathayibacter rathayi]
MTSAVPEPVNVPLGGGSIRLGQFLKLAEILSGGEAKEAVAEGLVTVNGEVDLRRGRQLAVGDVVGVDRNRFRVSE